MGNFFIVFVALFTSHYILDAQSFSKRLPPIGEIPVLVQQIATASDGSSSILFSGSFPNSINYAPIYLCDLDEMGNVVSGLSIHSTNDTLGWRWVIDYNRSDDLHAFNAIGHIINPLTNYTRNKSGLFVIDETNNIAWAKKTAGAVNTFKSTISQNHILTTRSMQSSGFPVLDHLSISCFQIADGTPVWEYDYYCQDISISNFLSSDLTTGPNEEIAVAGRAETSGAYFYFINTFNTAGTPLNSVRLPAYYQITSILYDEENSLYLAGQYNGSGGGSGFVAKFTNDLNLLWINELSSENYGYNQINLFPSPDNQVTFVSTDADDIPVISGIFAPDGELIRFQGYATQFADYSKDRNGGLAAVSGFSFIDGAINSIPFVFKADDEGIIEGCEAYNSCVSVTPLDLTTTSLSWGQEVAFPLPDIDITIQPITLATSDYCGTPPPPTPDFLLEDTVCQNTCLSPTGLNNQFANYVQWQLSGPGFDTVIVGANFQWCFTDPGSYFVEHQIWTLGCFNSFTDTVTVLPDNLFPPLGSDTIACTFPYTLSASSSRPLTAFVWNDGSTGSTLLAPSAGTYQITATDGYCQITDTILITDIETLYPPPLVQVVTDTTICEDEFPFPLHVQSPYINDFFLGTTPFRDSTVLLGANSYILRWMLEGCEFQETIQLVARNCNPNIYLPNIFSPNQDGVNDRVYPQGINFVTIELQVFDRWGGLVHTASGLESYWDGTRQGKPVSNGTYLVVLRYRNINSGKEGIMTQDVTLLR